MDHDYQALLPSSDDDDDIEGINISNITDNGIGNGNGNSTTGSNSNDAASVSTSVSSLLLWDQLNDEQSREVQNHQSRFHATPQQHTRDNPISIAVSIANQTVDNATTVLSKTSQRAKNAYKEWQHQQLNKHHQRRDRTDSNISDEFDLQFGISHDLLMRDDNDDDDDKNNNRDDDGGGGGEEEGGGEGGGNNKQQQQHTQDNNTNNSNHQDNNTSTNSRPLQGYPFVVLNEDRRDLYDNIPSITNPQIIGGSERDRWGMVGNLDIFLYHLYKYYYNRGITPMICSFLVETICLLFTLWLSRLLLIGVDWMKLLTMNCDDDYSDNEENTDNNNNNNNNNDSPDTPNNTNQCYSHLSDYARTEPLRWITFFLIQGYTFLVLSYTLFNTWTFYQGFGYAIQCRTILHDKLGLSERKLLGGALDWNTDILSALIDGQNSGRYKIIHHHTATNNDNTNTNTTRRSPMSTTPLPVPRTTATTTTPTDPHDSETGGGGSGGGTTATANPFSQHQQKQSPSPQSLTIPCSLPTPPPPIAFALNPHEQPNLDPLSITQRIMRKDNYMISFWNQGYIEKSCRFSLFQGSRYYWCSTLEFAVYQCILNFMFNHKMEIRPSFCLDSKSLEKRLKTCAIVVLLLEPFLLVFTIIHFILQHVYDASKTTSQSQQKSYMGHSKWSTSSKWIFREYNELPHYFEQRIQPTYQIAEDYCQLFGTSEYLKSIGFVFKFIGGSIGGVLLVLGIVVNDTLLLHVQLWGRNLVWYAGIAGIIFSVGKSLTTSTSTRSSSSNSVYASETNLFHDMDTKLKQISDHTHYYPYHWKNRGWDSKVYTNFKTYFDSEVKLFVYELVALLLTPYILYFNLSILSSDICEFCLLTKSKLKSTSSYGNSSNPNGTIIPGGGDVCGYSTFDFNKFTDEAWDGRTLGQSQRLHDEAELERELEREHNNGGESLSESIMRIGNVDDATRLYSKPKSKNGKMEKSCLTFKKNHHRNIAPPPSSLLSSDRDHRFENYHQRNHCHRRGYGHESTAKVTTKLSRSVQAQREHERDLHVEAATKQLDTLARIEENELQQQQQQREQQHQPQEQYFDPQDEQYHQHQHHQQHHQQQSTRNGNSSSRWNESHYSAQNQHQQERFTATNPRDESSYTTTSDTTTTTATQPFGYVDNNDTINTTIDAGRKVVVDVPPPPKTADAGAGISTQPSSSSSPSSPSSPQQASLSSSRSEISTLYPTQSAAALMTLLNNNNTRNDEVNSVTTTTPEITAQQQINSSANTTPLTSHNDRSTQNQYQWLERFNEHLVEEQQQEE